MIEAYGGYDTGRGVENIRCIIASAESDFDDGVICRMLGKGQERCGGGGLKKGERLTRIGIHNALQHIQ